LVRVDFDQLEAAFVGGFDFFEHRAQRLARAAPRGPKIHEYGRGHGGFDDLGFKVLYRDVHHGGQCSGLCFRPQAGETLKFNIDHEKHPMTQALIGVVMGSSSDWDTMQHAVQILQQFGIPHDARVVSAHRMPDDMFTYAETAAARGLQAIIAGAGGAAHLPGMLAAKTVVPVLGVPVQTKALSGVDSLHSIVQMPKGVPVATFAIGAAGAANAALFAVAMLANNDPALRQKLEAFRAEQTAMARAMTLPPVSPTGAA
jgi:5-(carboxyamino)imidazole ribonucleotide mutase